MNYRYGRTANVSGKKEKRSSAALALLVGLALAFPGPAALAGDPIPGVDVKLGKNPGGGIIVSAPTGRDGVYQFKGLAPGRYDLSIAGTLVQTISVGANQSISGMLTRNANGTASITVGDRKPVVLRGQIPGAAGVRAPAGDVNRDGVETRKAAPKKAAP